MRRGPKFWPMGQDSGFSRGSKKLSLHATRRRAGRSMKSSTSVTGRRMGPVPMSPDAPPHRSNGGAHPRVERKRDVEGNPKNGSKNTERWIARTRPPLTGNQNVTNVCEDAEMEDTIECIEDRDFGFQTARVKLAADMRKSGGGKAGYNPGHYSSGNIFNNGQAAAGRAMPRVGLHKPRKPENTGVRSGFVPPFVRKALDGPPEPGKEKENSLLSPKTLEMLAGPDGELPEALARLDPAILEMVCSEIMDCRAGVQWEDIAGQEDAKRLVQELVVWPMLNPHLFRGARAPPKGLLLFGPPGTGKTLIGKAIASNISATFFNISASSLTSKWIGEGEKMVRALFAVGWCNAAIRHLY
eukprot:jgi/Botrbrau1/550/Bobra.0010s0025.1